MPHTHPEAPCECPDKAISVSSRPGRWSWLEAHRLDPRCRGPGRHAALARALPAPRRPDVPLDRPPRTERASAAWLALVPQPRARGLSVCPEPPDPGGSCGTRDRGRRPSARACAAGGCPRSSGQRPPAEGGPRKDAAFWARSLLCPPAPRTLAPAAGAPLRAGARPWERPPRAGGLRVPGGRDSSVRPRLSEAFWPWAR